MKTQMKVLLYLKRNEADANNYCSLMCRITIKGNANSSVCLSTKLKVQLALWNATSQRCTGKSKIAIKTNREIEAMLLLLHARFDDLCKTNDIIKAIDVKNAFQGSVESQTMLLQLFREYNNEYSQRVGVNRVANSFYKYQNTYRLIKEFRAHRYKVSDVTLKSLDMVFMESFDAFLRVDKKQQPNTRKGNIIRLNSVVKSAIYKGVLSVNPFRGFKLEQPIQKQRYLSQEDLNKLMTTTMTTEKRGLVRDLFLFSCFTGLGQGDLAKLTKEHITTDNNGEKWIKIERGKTGVESVIKLLAVPLWILERYPNGFMVPNPQILAVQLITIAEMAQLDIHLTFYMARHTFATEVCLNNGVPIETISKMLGHTSIKTTQVYAEITSQKLTRDLTKLAKTANQKYKLQNQPR